MNKGTTLTQYLEATTNNELKEVILALAKASARISEAVRFAGLSDIVGDVGTTNVQGEIVQKLDLYSNDLIVEELKKTIHCGAVVSEETDGVLPLSNIGRYIIATDPLDGSGNIDIAAPIGTIYALFERKSTGEEATAADFMQTGDNVLSTGYALYGSSTILVLSVGKGTVGFTLDRSGDFILSTLSYQIPETGKIYSLNQGNLNKFDEGIKEFIGWCSESDKATSRPYALRYIGSMVGDLHRTLIKGGIFIYPANKGETKGKLRLMYECIPMAYLVEQAGGAATDGNQRILSVQPVDIHERTAIFIGSKATVSKCESFLKQPSAV
jgi:fructose-1,6-bisphosphatase I